METFVYRAMPNENERNEFNAVNMSVSYSKGRGIFLHVGKAKHERDCWSTIIDFNPRTNNCALLESLSRGNAKRLQYWEAQLAKNKEEIADAFLSPDDDYMTKVAQAICR